MRRKRRPSAAPIPDLPPEQAREPAETLGPRPSIGGRILSQPCSRSSQDAAKPSPLPASAWTAVLAVLRELERVAQGAFDPEARASTGDRAPDQGDAQADARSQQGGEEGPRGLGCQDSAQGPGLRNGDGS